MTVVDRSEFNTGRLPADCTGTIERVAHGTTEDKTWRVRYNEAVARGVPVGFYYVPEFADPAPQARYFAGLINGIFHTMGDWLDYAVGDLGSLRPSVGFVDIFRSIIDTGLYVNGAAFGLLVPYQRFERLWYAGSASPPRWLMRQPGGLDQGDDIDLAADLGVGVRPSWSAFSWPNA